MKIEIPPLFQVREKLSPHHLLGLIKCAIPPDHLHHHAVRFNRVKNTHTDGQKEYETVDLYPAVWSIRHNWDEVEPKEEFCWVLLTDLPLDTLRTLAVFR